MVHKCAGFGCRSGCRDCSGIGEDGEKITFHAFPIGNPELCEKWVRANPRKGFIPTKYSKLCSLHFHPRDFIQEYRDTNVSRQKNKATEKPKRRHLKDDVIPSVFPNAPTGTCFSKTQVAPKASSTAIKSSRYPEEVKRLESFERASLEIYSLTLTEVEEQMRAKKCDIPLETTGRSEHFMNIAETLVKYQENGFLCDAVLVSKCGRELKAHSAILAAVSPVFLMAIEEKPSSGPYHLCFPEVEFDVLEVAVHFVYTGKLLLPTVYSQMDQLSMLFNKLSDLGLSLHKLNECKMTFVRSAKQPPKSSIAVKEEDADSKTNLKDSVRKLQASCEWPVDKKPSSADAFSEVMIVDVAPNDGKTSHTRGDSEENCQSTLGKQKGQGNWRKEGQKRKHGKTQNKNVRKERLPSNALVVHTATAVTKPVMRPTFSILTPLLSELNTPAAALHYTGTCSREMNNLPDGLLDQNLGKINTLDSDSYGIHEAIVNDSEEPNHKTKTQGDILNLADPSPTLQLQGDKQTSKADMEKNALRPNVVEKEADKACISCSQIYKCEHCTEPNSETFTNDIELLWHKIKHHWDLCNVCDYCGRRFNLRKNLKCHIKRHLGIYPQKKHKCNDCGLYFITPHLLQVHRLRHTGEKPHECSVCRKRFRLQENMQRHQLLHTGYRPFLCDFCGKGFTRKTGLMDHVTLHHDFECAICSCKQTSKADMEKHALEVHQLVKFNWIIKNPRTYLCDLCGKNCISACSLRIHIKGHRKKPLHCETCGKKFSKSYNLRLHMRLHTGERPFVCNACQECFTRKSTLMMHLTTHSGIKPFDCVICSNSFASKCQLKQHLKQHMITCSDKKRFKCGICNNQFTSKASLIVHHRIHTGERPYKCRICSKQFMENSSLTIHIRSHTGDKPFRCTVCVMSFTQSQHLTRHMRTHTGEKPFVCEICSKSYKQKIDLRYHLTRFHKIDVASKSLSENIEIDGKVSV